MDIHLLHRKDETENIGILRRLDTEGDTWESGYWQISEETAVQAVEQQANLFLHKCPGLPSFWGGVIEGFRVEAEGEFQNRVVFRFRPSVEHKNVPGGTNWSYECKVVR